MAARREVITYHPLPAPGAVNSLKDQIQSKVMETVEKTINSLDPKSLPQHIEGVLEQLETSSTHLKPKWTGHKDFPSERKMIFLMSIIALMSIGALHHRRHRIQSTLRMCWAV